MVNVEVEFHVHETSALIFFFNGPGMGSLRQMVNVVHSESTVRTWDLRNFLHINTQLTT